MFHQPTINLMTIGHVANGKSTTMEALSGQITMRHTSELKRNITIKLGYTSFKIFKIPKKSSPECYVAKSSETKEYNDPETGEKAELIRHFSFIDNPGHQIYMRTMLIGASVADGALLIIAANAQNCPEKQTEEHLSATTMLGLNSLVVAQNKIDLVKDKKAAKQYEHIMKFLRRNSLGNAPIVPICAIKTKVNIDALCAHLIKKIKKPERIKKSPPRLYVIRSFDVNKPREIKKPSQFKGGVAGCVLMRGFLRVGDKLEIRPGLVTTKGIAPISVKVNTLLLGSKKINYIGPGCNVGVGLNVDPYLTKQDTMVGQVLGPKETLPDVFTECIIEYRLLTYVLGADEKILTKTNNLIKNDELNIAIGACTVNAIVLETAVPILFLNKQEDATFPLRKKRSGTCRIQLEYPVCYDLWTKLLITKQVNKSWRLVGCGQIRMIKSEKLSSVSKINFINRDE